MAYVGAVELWTHCMQILWMLYTFILVHPDGNIGWQLCRNVSQLFQESQVNDDNKQNSWLNILYSMLIIQVSSNRIITIINKQGNSGNCSTGTLTALAKKKLAHIADWCRTNKCMTHTKKSSETKPTDSANAVPFIYSRVAYNFTCLHSKPRPRNVFQPSLIGFLLLLLCSRLLSIFFFIF